MPGSVHPDECYCDKCTGISTIGKDNRPTKKGAPVKRKGQRTLDEYGIKLPKHLPSTSTSGPKLKQTTLSQHFNKGMFYLDGFKAKIQLGSDKHD